MSRLRDNGIVIEWITHPATQRRSALRLIKRTMTFFARTNDEDWTSDRFESQNGDEVRKWLVKHLGQTRAEDKLEWRPVIKIEQTGEARDRYRDDTQLEGESLALAIDRFYVALTRDKKEWRRLPWEACDSEAVAAIPEEDRFAVSRRYANGPKAVGGQNFQLPHFDTTYRGSETVLEYTPELWAGLLAIVQSIATARQGLADLVHTKQGIARLLEVGVRTPLLLTGKVQ